MKKLMIYGAAGYTGSMVAQYAASAGVSLILAGRPEKRASLEKLADSISAEVRTFDLDDSEILGMGLRDIGAVINAAGPFTHSAPTLTEAAIRAGVHYLDFSAELETYRQALALHEAASAKGVMLLPGSGGSVAMLGCLASQAATQVLNPVGISIALDVAGPMSKGSIKSASQGVVNQTLHLLGGQLRERSPADVRDFDFGGGPQPSFPVTLPDLLTIHRTTGVGNIETFVHIHEGAFPNMGAVELAGPGVEERATNRYHAAVEVTGANGTVARAVLDTVNGYTFTAMAAAVAAKRVLAGEFCPGFQTPAGLFGSGFVLTIADTRITHLPTE